MKQIFKILKWMVVLGVLALLVLLLVHFAVKVQAVTDTVRSWFKSDPIVIDVSKDAKTTYIGYTEKQINNQKKEEKCPTKDDVFRHIYIQDYEDVVIFYKIESNIDGLLWYPNLLFLKTDKGLMFDGCANLRGDSYGRFGEETSFEWTSHFDEVPNIEKYEPVVLSSGNAYFTYKHGFCFWGADLSLQLQRAQKYIIENLYPYFLSFNYDNVKIIQSADDPVADLNAFYNYIYSCTKIAKENKRMVDVSELTYWAIPEEEQAKYPRTPTKDDLSTTFKFYNVNVYLISNYEKFERTVLRSTYTKNIDENLKDKEIASIDVPVKTIPYVTVFLKEANAKEGDLTYEKQLNNLLETYPVEVVFSNKDVQKTLTFTRYDSKAIALDEGDYEFVIRSEYLSFENEQGQLSIRQNGDIIFNCSIERKVVDVQFSLKSKQTMIEDIDISQTPVNVKLSKDGITYEATFSSVSDVKILKLPVGEFQYRITSTFLKFDNLIGTLTITTNDSSFMFLFEYEKKEEETKNTYTLKFTETIRLEPIIIVIPHSVLGVSLSKKPEDEYMIHLTKYLPNGTVEVFRLEKDEIGELLESVTRFDGYDEWKISASANDEIVQASYQISIFVNSRSEFISDIVQNPYIHVSRIELALVD